MDVLSRVFDNEKEELDPLLNNPLTASEFRAKKAELEAELESIRNGTCKTLLDLADELRRSRDEELEIAERWRTFLVNRAQEEYEVEMKAAKEEYEYRCKTLKEMVLSHLNEKKRKIYEAKDMFDIGSESSTLLLHDASSQFIDRRKLRHRRNAGNQQNTQQLPSLNFFDDYLLFPTDETAVIPQSVKNAVRNSVNSVKPTSAEASLFSPLLSMANANPTNGRERDPRASERAERDREKAVEKGLSGATEEDIQSDLQLLKKELAKKK
ncbi:Transcriptional regulatory protein sds3 [Schizosaccharomyces pombe]|uniref:Transcriptional regulatory protein sds3 n=1 Tax=Schizosaccharomyces pombe (strain 972 / ATCC 24843) TaxID=284812 RepID=SDS3_SCHPO|nr:Clr6 histone deacetylase complex subunit Sds3 [Schizosaccharomyces pombe]Q9UTB6.1 RecName: Full=Transcriptional regulatory protein sds3; AltName: Full=Clr6 histone deacetylase complex I subunit Sds3 [Schizosaccharomyces pombe 972h-]8I03_G Chain G, Transcriptional regulatory protein sds3 [Schizosaccharomyces pombe]CAB61768.1 Clr6 histone deacetylase complex subunit Sds3 [Schizosaccharomyces pombe]|eukprot:NP_594462.1 Clr6 histone deacetylase complex subunit Sds3 [Schizosaccharomyces pombe]